MAKYSAESISRLETCHEDLQTLFYEVLKNFDHKILCGARGPIEQGAAFAAGQSTKQYPDSLHNVKPPNRLTSYAVDAAPYPIDFSDIKRFYFFAGFVLGVADQMHEDGLISHAIRWGGDWDGDTEVKDNKFNDLVHFEIVGD